MAASIALVSMAAVGCSKGSVGPAASKQPPPSASAPGPTVGSTEAVASMAADVPTMVAPTSSTTEAFVPPTEVALDTTTPPSCATAVAMHDPVTLLSAFRAARIARHGAEGCVTAAVLRHYQEMNGDTIDSSPGPMCLYGCGRYRLSDIVVSVSTADRAYWNLDVALRNAQGQLVQQTLPETLTIGPGRTSTGVQAVQVITDASNN